MNTYQLTPWSGLLSHGRALDWLVLDGDDDESSDTLERRAAQARVRSGDYFITLATELEEVAQNVNLARDSQTEILESLVRELLYLDEHYRISRK